MTLFGMTLDQIFLEVLNLSLAALPLMAAVLILRLAFRRAPRRVMCLLWLAVWLRLLLPVHLEVPWGIAPAQAIPEETALGVPVTPAGAAAIAYELVGDTANGGLGLIGVPTADPGGSIAGGYTFALHDEAWLLVWGWLWPLGMCAMVLHSLLSLLGLKRRLAEAARVEGRAWEADGLDTAFLLGLFRPRIYLPSGLGDAERAIALAHEGTHLRYGDHVWKLLAYLALCVHWFDPLVWVCFHLFVRDMEVACDEAVTRDMTSEERADYAAALVRLAGKRRSPAAAPLAFGEGDARGRVRRLLSFRKPQSWLTALAVMAAGLAAGMMLVSRAAGLPVNPYLGAGYTVSEVVYNNPISSYFPYTENTTLGFCVTPDYRLLAREFPRAEDLYAPNTVGWAGWQEIGQLAPVELTRDELLELCQPTVDDDLPQKVGELSAVWQAQSEEGVLYLVIQTADGEFLLARGASGLQPEDALIYQLYQLERQDSYADADGYNALALEYAMDFDSLSAAFSAERGLPGRGGSSGAAIATRAMGNGYDVVGYALWLKAEEEQVLSALGLLVLNEGAGNGHGVDVAFRPMDELTELAPGCYLFPEPASSGPHGDYPVGGTCDVIFTTNPEAVTVERVVRDAATGGETGRQEASLREGLRDEDSPGMAVFPWSEGASQTVSYHFYRTDGTEITS